MIEVSGRSGWRMVLGLLAALALGALFAWAAFGPGPRHCSTSFSFGFIGGSRHGGELVCRGAFGVVTVLALAVVLLSAAAILRLRAPSRIADALQKAGEWLAILLLAPLLLVAALCASPVWIARWAVRRVRAGSSGSR